MAVKWAFRADPSLRLLYQDNIAALLHEPTSRRAAGDAVFASYSGRPCLQYVRARSQGVAAKTAFS